MHICIQSNGFSYNWISIVCYLGKFRMIISRQTDCIAMISAKCSLCKLKIVENSRPTIRHNEKKTNEMLEKPWPFARFQWVSSLPRSFLSHFSVSAFPKILTSTRTIATILSSKICSPVHQSQLPKTCECYTFAVLSLSRWLSTRIFAVFRVSAWIQLHISRGIKMLTCLNSGKCFVYATFFVTAVKRKSKKTLRKRFGIVYSVIRWDKRTQKAVKNCIPCFFPWTVIVASQQFYSIKCFNISHTGNAGYFCWQY